MRFGKDSEYINWIRKFKKYNISFDYDIMSNGFYIYECNGMKFKWNEQSNAYTWTMLLTLTPINRTGFVTISFNKEIEV